MVSNPWKPKKQVAAPAMMPLNPKGKKPPDPAFSRMVGSSISSGLICQLWKSTVLGKRLIDYSRVISGIKLRRTFEASADDDVRDNTQVAHCENVVETSRLFDSQSQNGYSGQLDEQNRNKTVKNIMRQRIPAGISKVYLVPVRVRTRPKAKRSG